jgi:carbamoyltransferase
MSKYVLSFKPVTRGFGRYDPSAVVFRDGTPVFGIEEERLSRNKHAINEFPERSIRACLSYCDCTLSDIDEIVIPYDHTLLANLVMANREKLLSNPAFFGRIRTSEESSRSFLSNASAVIGALGTYTGARSGALLTVIENRLESLFGGPVPPITSAEHHACHAASAYYPAPFDDGLVLTIDGKGEYDSTVVWRATDGMLTRERTYTDPNSLGFFFAAITEFLGYRAYNGEGKVMGLAPYGEHNEGIEQTLSRVVSGGVDYDVTGISTGMIEDDVRRLERLFDRPRKRQPKSFSQWEKDLAFSAQQFLQDTVVAITEEYCRQFGTANVGLAGGVALNCKMNKRLMEHEAVETLFVQPLAHDGGLAFGAGLLEQQAPIEFQTVYYGPDYTAEEIKRVLETNRIDYREPADITQVTAEHIANGDLVGWFQGRLEMGPRALGNRSILADPRTIESRTRVNRDVKHREEWRPFAPSMHEDAADEYLENAEPSPYMIKTFDATDRAVDEIPAALHPGDNTTRPQTVTEAQNPRYYELIRNFEAITGVPVVLNTSFNDHGEPIVTHPREALKDFYGIGLDVLVLDKFLVEKAAA